MRENIMIDKLNWNYIQLLLISFVIITFLSHSGIAQGEQPEYEVSPPVVVIKVTPQPDAGEIEQTAGTYDTEDIKDVKSEEYLQKTMEVNWHPSVDKDDIDLSLKFQIEDSLALMNGDSKINPEYIEVREEGESEAEYSTIGSWKTLDNRVKVLDKNKLDSEIQLEFRLNSEIYEDNNWQDVEAGVYKGQITPNIGLPGDSNNRLKMIVIVESVVNVDVPDELELTVEKPVEDKSAAIDWGVNTNIGNIKVEFESDGIKLEDAKDREIEENYIDYSEFFRYYVENDSDNSKHEFVPGGIAEVSYTAGELKLRYSSDDYGDEDWYELLAGKYEDTVTITVSEN